MYQETVHNPLKSKKETMTTTIRLHSLLCRERFSQTLLDAEGLLPQRLGEDRLLPAIVLFVATTGSLSHPDFQDGNCRSHKTIGDKR